MNDRSWNFAGAPTGELLRVSVPGAQTIADIAAAFNIDPSDILKCSIWRAESLTPTRWLAAVIRGDHEVDAKKLAEAARELFGITALRKLESSEALAQWPSGFVGPDAVMRTADAVMLVDPAAAQGQIAWIAGGNETDLGVQNFNWFRECGDRLADPVKVIVADLRKP